MRFEIPSLCAAFHFSMNSGFSDPNNHVPEVTPDDAWGDSDSHFAEVAQPTAILPPRRSLVLDKPASRVEPVEIGLRIDTRLMQDEPSEVPRKLEVLDFNTNVIRLDQDENSPPKVDRIVTFHERPASLPSRGNPHGEGREWGHAHRGSLRWLWGMGGGVALLVVLGIALLPAINAPNAARELPGSDSPFTEEDTTSLLARQMGQMLQQQPEAMQTYRSFIHATTADEALTFIHGGEALKDTLRANWKPVQIPDQWAPPDDSTWTVIDREGHALGLLQGVLPDLTKFTAYFALNDQNQLLLDWKATTGYGTSPFVELEGGPCDASEIRGVVSFSDFYTSVLPEADYQCFRLTSPDERNFVWCYTLRDSEEFTRISAELNPGSIDTESRKPIKATLRLECGPVGSLKNQWLIGELLHLDWTSP